MLSNIYNRVVLPKVNTLVLPDICPKSLKYKRRIKQHHYDFETDFKIMTCNSLSESTFTSIYVTLSVFWCVLMSFDDVLYIPTGLSYQLSSASTHSLPSRIDQLSDSENDFDIEEDDSSSALGNSSFCIEFFSTKIYPKYAKICLGGWVLWSLGCKPSRMDQLSDTQYGQRQSE